MLVSPDQIFYIIRILGKAEVFAFKRLETFRAHMTFLNGPTDDINSRGEWYSLLHNVTGDRVRDVERTGGVSEYNNKRSVLQREINAAAEPVDRSRLVIDDALGSIAPFTQNIWRRPVLGQ